MSPGCMFHKALEEEHVPEIDSLLNFALVSRRDGCTEALSKVCENTTKGRTHLCNFTWKLQFHHGINHSHTGASSKANKKRRQMEKLETHIKPLKHNLKLHRERLKSTERVWECVSGCLSRILILEKGKKGEILPIQNLDCRIEPRWRWHWCCFCCCADALCPPEDWPFLESKKIEEQ